MRLGGMAGICPGTVQTETGTPGAIAGLAAAACSLMPSILQASEEPLPPSSRSAGGCWWPQQLGSRAGHIIVANALCVPAKLLAASAHAYLLMCISFAAAASMRGVPRPVGSARRSSEQEGDLQRPQQERAQGGRGGGRGGRSGAGRGGGRGGSSRGSSRQWEGASSRGMGGERDEP